jgi:tRNA (cmo5U34)-methyltransferase
MLGKNGLYVTVENYRPDSAKGIEVSLARWRRFQLEQGRSGQTVDDHLKRFGTEYFPVTISDHLRLLSETGFTESRLFWLSQMQAGFYSIKV